MPEVIPIHSLETIRAWICFNYHNINIDACTDEVIVSFDTYGHFGDEMTVSFTHKDGMTIKDVENIIKEQMKDQLKGMIKHYQSMIQKALFILNHE